MRDPTGTNTDQRRTGEKAAVVLLIGLILLMPPVANIFSLQHKIAGIPFMLVYLFVVWAGLIFAGFRMSRRMLQDYEVQRDLTDGED